MSQLNKDVHSLLSRPSTSSMIRTSISVRFKTISRTRIGGESWLMRRTSTNSTGLTIGKKSRKTPIFRRCGTKSEATNSPKQFKRKKLQSKSSRLDFNRKN
jgi:hypothetical protein